MALPDKGTGHLSSESTVVTLHSYITSLNESEAVSVRQLPFISLCEKILPGGEDDGESGLRAINKTLAPTLPTIRKETISHLRETITSDFVTLAQILAQIISGSSLAKKVALKLKTTFSIRL
jgi:hypothetical protein